MYEITTSLRDVLALAAELHISRQAAHSLIRLIAKEIYKKC